MMLQDTRAIHHINTDLGLFSGEHDIGCQLAAARPRLQRLARLRGVAPDAIEDVVQETLLEAWNHLDRLHTPSGFSLWLDEICRNICRRHARQQIMDRRRLSPLAAPYEYEDERRGGALADVPQQLADDDLPDPLDALDRQDRALLVDRALGALPDTARELVELRYLLELPQREVAERLGLSLSALEARLHRVRQQLRETLNGPLRAEAAALDLPLDAARADGWRETRVWCSLCGRRRLMGLFLPQPDGSVNLHMRCPECEERYGLDDVDSSNVHSKGLVELTGLQAFRPAWKRTMQRVTERLIGGLLAEEHRCLYCGALASLQLVDKALATETREEAILPDGLAQHPYQFWVWWRCPHCHRSSNTDAGIFAASDLVYWSHARPQQFMRDHPHWISEPELLVEHAGLPAIRFQMADLASAARLTILAHRQTLRVLAVF